MGYWDMSDKAWFIIIGVLFAVLGLLFVWLGWQIWRKRRMNLIISYHCDKVSEEDKAAYCTLMGIGVFLMGIGFLLSGIGTLFSQSFCIFIPMTVGLVVGIVLLISACVKYNR